MKIWLLTVSPLIVTYIWSVLTVCALFLLLAAGAID